jgi:dTMP kinase
MFIVIEGADANGKATQSKLTREKLGGQKVDAFMPYEGKCVLFSFPRYSTPLGQAILRHLKREIVVVDSGLQVSAETLSDCEANEDPMIFQCMMTIDKYHAAEEIRWHLRAGRHVVCDRWRQSAEIYGAADGLDVKWLDDIHGGLPPADLSIYLEVSAEEALRRRPGLRDRYEKDAEKQKRIRHLYRELWERKIATGGKDSWVVVNGMGTVEEVNSEIMSAVARRLLR